MTKDEMIGQHHQLDGHEFEKALGVGDGQGSLVCCSPMGSQRVGHDCGTELTDYIESLYVHIFYFHISYSSRQLR